MLGGPATSRRLHACVCAAIARVNSNCTSYSSSQQPGVMMRLCRRGVGRLQSGLTAFACSNRYLPTHEWMCLCPFYPELLYALYPPALCKRAPSKLPLHGTLRKAFIGKQGSCRPLRWPSRAGQAPCCRASSRVGAHCSHVAGEGLCLH